MSVSVITSFRVNGRWIDQLIDTKTDVVSFTESGNTILTIDSSGYVTKVGEEKYLGKFSLRKNLWMFCFFNNNFVSINDCDKITTPMYDLIGAEMLVVKELIKRNMLEV